jgi:anti-sigma factor (TIGR02949 family)
MGDHDCDDLLSELGHLLHGDLTADRKASLQQHMEACPPCMETADFQAQLRMLIVKRCGEEVPEGLRDRITGLLGGSPTGEAIS